ncbi:S41 family peptidase [Catalinimonas alkaloidigena]|uniref:S41 family peptidase n=1 Tax=Catalinimonas alkaloidigena TaxID=1075417 RepID=UPI002407721B|nr:S41 family peptidase [Catalinimonas alkaloidigena]
MKKSVWIFLASLSFIILLLPACKQDEDIVSPLTTDDVSGDHTADNAQNDLLNNWIYEVMSSYYYWNEEVSLPDSSGEEPEDYFYSLINDADEFSYITDDYEGLMEEFSGVYSSMGYSPAFGLLSASNEVFIVVEYVYPDSPADRAGLERGDIILAIDGETLNTENYYELYGQSQYMVTLAAYDEAEGINPTDQTISLFAEVIETDPVLYKEVKTAAGKKVGYMVYTEFISGENEEWLNNLGSTLDEFAQANVREVIIDLRYNPGGEIYTAQYFASALAPVNVVNSEEVLVKFDYNTLLESSIVAYEGDDSENLVSKFVSNGHNLNLSRIYFLTGSGTASASELLINGLKPYMDVVMIGEHTVGKYYGSWVIPDLAEPARHDWAIMPIVLKYTNAEGVTDFSEGLTPDYPVEDNLLDAKPFGDESDPLLATALDLISGGLSARLKSRESFKPYQELGNPLKIKKNKLFIDDSLVPEIE